jgi:hypothetical protein
MTEATWKPLPDECCLHCGDGGEVLTDQPPGYWTDGDQVRCVGCGCPGQACADPDEGWINWHDEPNCGCSWCKAIQQGSLDGMTYLMDKHAGNIAVTGPVSDAIRELIAQQKESNV